MRPTEPMDYVNDFNASDEALNFTNREQRDCHAHSAGRRVCADMSFAHNSLLTNMAGDDQTIYIRKVSISESKIVSQRSGPAVCHRDRMRSSSPKDLEMLKS